MPGTSESVDSDMRAALKAARDHYRVAMLSVMRDMRELLAGRSPRELIGQEVVRYLTLRVRFDELALAQRDYAEARLAQRQDSAARAEAVAGE